MGLRIAHCIHGLGLGGAQKVLESIVTSIRAPDIKHFVYCSLDGPVRHSLEDAGIRVQMVPRHLSKFDPLLVSRLSRKLKRDRIDLVHTHLFGDSLHCFVAANTGGQIPVVMTLHNNQGRFNRLQQLGYRWLLPRCAAVVACAPSVGASFLKDQPILEEKLIVISNGINIEETPALKPEEEARLRADLGLAPASRVLTAMGRFVEQKGYSFLIRAFSELSEKLRAETQLLLLGQGPLEESLKQMSCNLKLSDRIIFGGYRQDIPRILGITDVVAFSSLWEGLPIALLEAMASQKCIVATDIEGFRDAVEADREAVLAPPGDPAGLGTALEQVLSDPGLRSELALQARTRFLEDFTALKMVQSYERIYRGLLQPDRPQTRS